METWKILIISLLAAVAVGSIGGILIGKILLKRARSNRKPLLSKEEKIIYAACLIVGTASILFGVFYNFPTADESMMDPDGIVIAEDGTTTQAAGGGGGRGNAGAGTVVRRSGGGGVRVATRIG